MGREVSLDDVIEMALQLGLETMEKDLSGPIAHHRSPASMTPHQLTQAVFDGVQNPKSLKRSKGLGPFSS